MQDQTINICIIGLGKVGSAFFDAIRQRQSLHLVCVSDLAETPTKAQAIAEGIKIATLDEIVAMGKKIDVIFELTGSQAVRKELREKLHNTRNYHTVVASETIARLIWPLIGDVAQ